MKPSIHPAAIVEPGAQLGDGCVVHAGAIIRSGAILAENVAVHPYAVLGEDRCSELRRLARPLSQAVVAAGTLPLAR